MKVALNAMQAGNRSGTGVYTMQLARWLPELAGDLDVAIYWPEGVALPKRARDEAFVLQPARGGIGRVAYDQWGFLKDAHKAGAHLLHFPATVGSILPARDTIVTIHDLTFMREPDWYGWEHAAYLKYATRWSARHARRILSVSEATKADIVEMLKVDPDRVDVVPNGIDERFAPAEEEEVDRVAHHYRLPELFVLFVGTLEPRKNVVRLIQAFSQAADVIPHNLVLAGREGWKYEPIHEAAAASHHADRIHFIGHVPPEDLPGLYSAADIFAFPSLFEGFGIPVAEAMACGTPVVTSNASSLPEVAGDAAIFVDPYDIDSIAHGLVRIATDDTLCAQLQEAGLERGKLFSWKHTAEGVIDSYRKALP